MLPQEARCAIGHADCVRYLSRSPSRPRRRLDLFAFSGRAMSIVGRASLFKCFSYFRRSWLPSWLPCSRRSWSSIPRWGGTRWRCNCTPSRNAGPRTARRRHPEGCVLRTVHRHHVLKRVLPPKIQPKSIRFCTARWMGGRWAAGRVLFSATALVRSSLSLRSQSPVALVCKYR